MAIRYLKRPISFWEDELSYEDSYLRNTAEYKHYRDVVLQKDKYQCIICGSTQNLEVHHIYPFALFPNDRIDSNCGCTLCQKHHTGSQESFHKIYGNRHNTPEQLQDYVNMMRNELGINEYFDVYDYMNPYDADCMEIDDTMLDMEIV